MNNEKQALVPRLRFPEFRDERWKMISIDKIAAVKKGVQRNRVDLSEDGLYPVINGGVNPSGYCDEWNTEAETITISEGGNSCGFVQLVDQRFWCGGHCYALNRLKAHKFFLYHVLKSQERKIMSLRVGSGLPNIQKTDLLRILVGVTESSVEQQKIADCLSSLDALISAQAGKLDALKTHKKGLMQQLFPREGETVPRLRFPEFREAREWEQRKLDELAIRIGDGIHGTPKYDDNGCYFFVNGNNLIDGRIQISESTKKVDRKEAGLHSRELSNRTILLSINGTIGNLALYNNEKVLLGKSAAYINLKDNVEIGFIYSTLTTSKVRDFFFGELTGSTIKNLSLKTIRETEVCIPGVPEQQKIADCLFSLDALIAAQAEKLDALKTHKKGLMQQLFPRLEA